MTEAQFLQTLARLTKRYPMQAQSDKDDPCFVAKLFDIA
jgi:hypothetical protein